MNDNYQKMSELLDNWLSFSSKEVKMALIEKEILLEKMRRLYVHVSNLETEEYEAPKPEIAEPAQEPAPKKEYTRAKIKRVDGFRERRVDGGGLCAYDILDGLSHQF